jgi:predicted nucleic acid-binding protein
MTYCLDTNIISYDISDTSGIRDRVDSAWDNGDTVVVPPISYYEVKRGFLFKDQKRRLSYFDTRYGNNLEGSMFKEDWEQAAVLYSYLLKQHLNAADDDLFQAAFCIRRGYTLVTHNTKHFENIPGLLLEDWCVE